jgi:hypothetical protein
VRPPSYRAEKAAVFTQRSLSALKISMDAPASEIAGAKEKLAQCRRRRCKSAS